MCETIGNVPEQLLFCLYKALSLQSTVQELAAPAHGIH